MAIRLPAVLSRFRRSAAIAAVALGLVGGFEGQRTKAYLDVAAIPTICYGETRGIKLGDTATPQQCKALLADRLAEDSAAIDRCLPADLPDPTYVAFLSAAYNIGAPAFCSSSMARQARAGDLVAACDALPLWDKATIAGVKVRVEGLARRRAEERALCLTGTERVPK